MKIRLLFAYVREMNIVFVNYCRVKSISRTVEIQMENAEYIPFFIEKMVDCKIFYFMFFRIMIFTFVSHSSIIVIQKEVTG